MRVLVIDDQPMLREAARRVLERDCCDVVVAASGAGGLELLEGGGFDAILCDMEMPEMSGLEVWSRLPEEMRGRFVMWTGAPWLAEGASFEVLEKPVSNDDLRAAVRRAAT